MIRALSIIFFVAVLGYGADFNLIEDSDTGIYSFDDDLTTDSLDMANALEVISDNITKLKINAPKATLTLNSASIGTSQNKNYTFDITAQELTLTGNASDKSATQIQAFLPSRIQADTALSSARISLSGSNLTTEPTLSIQGNFEATNSLIEHYETSQGVIQSSFIVSGTSTIRDTEFNIITTSRTTKPILSYVVMSSLGGFNTDVLVSNTASIKASKSISMLEQQYKVSIDPSSQYAGVFRESKDTLFNTTLKQEGTSLIVERTLGSATFKDIEQKNLEIDKEIIEDFLNNVVKLGNERTNLGHLLNFITMRQEFLSASTQTDAEILAQYNQEDNPVGDIVLSAFNAHQAIKDYIGLGLANDVLYNNAQGSIKEIINNARSSLEIAKTTSSAVSVINVSNDMAISTRIAAANNPYAYLASLSGQYFAALENLPALYYVDSPYPNGVWANAFGGANIIDSETGGLYGISIGYDQKNFEHALFGVYFTYANAVIKEGNIQQRSNNYQVGFYSSFNPIDIIEMNFKLYGQLATIHQTSFTQDFDEMNADFTRHFAGVSFNVGRIFAFDENTFYAKPFLGANYYYTFTPSYIEKGNAAQETQSITNHAASAEFGVDLRQYIGQNSFLYLTPKVEQYFIESGDDYIAGFLGSNTNFAIKANHYNKTYFQLILGGNFDISQHFNITLGFGAKQAIKCACESKNETYLSGNLGLRYRY